MIVMQCEKCKEIYNIIYGKGLLCAKCGHYTKDAIVDGIRTYGLLKNNINKD